MASYRRSTQCTAPLTSALTEMIPESRDLQGAVSVVHSRHEFGERWSPKYGIGGKVKVCHVEDDVLRVEVVAHSESDR